MRRTRTQRRPLRPEDAARLHMSVPHNPMVITAALLFEGGLERDALLARFEQRLPHARFRQRVVEPRLGLGAPCWQDDATFDLRAHVRLAERGARSLEELVSELASTPLSRDRPLWHADLATLPNGDAVLVMRVHHCIGDGTALVALLGDLSDERPPHVAARAPEPQRRRRGRVRELLVGAIGAMRWALQRREPRTSLRGRVGKTKRVAFSVALPLGPLREAAHALGATLTDVLLAALAGALRTLLHPPDAVRRLHALVPMSVAAAAGADGGNRFVSVFVPLPLGVADPRARVHDVREAIRAIRAHGAVGAALGAVTAAGVSTAAFERLGVALFSRRASVVVSSVHGPTARLHLAGAAVRDLVVWAPVPGSIALGVSFLSYAGAARIGVVADAHVVRDPNALVRELERELETLLAFRPAET